MGLDFWPLHDYRTENAKNKSLTGPMCPVFNWYDVLCKMKNRLKCLVHIKIPT